AGTNRLDSFIVRIPKGRLTGGAPLSPPEPPPPPPPTPTTSPLSLQPVRWTDLLNVTAMSNTLQKTGGCGGCEDAGAVSAQQIASGDAWMEFTASETNTLRVIGLSSRNRGTARAEIK